MPDWFAGVAEDLAAETTIRAVRSPRDQARRWIGQAAEEAVRGVRVDTVPPVPTPPTTYARDWVAEFDRAHQHGTQEWVDREIRRRRDAQERRDRNTAMVLWGIHL